MTKSELYDWYLDNCTKNEIPLSYKEWEREIFEIEKNSLQKAGII